MRRLASGTIALSVAIATLGFGPPSAVAKADSPMVYPGMEIRQDTHLCTLGYVDAALKMAFTAGHCRGGGVVTDKDRNPIGHLKSFRDTIPSGTTVTLDQPMDDYEAIVLDDNVVISNVLPGGRPLQSAPGTVIRQGEPVCHFGVITGETCGTVEHVNNGWFTMSNGVQSHRGDSGGPIYLAPNGGPGQIIGIFNSLWGDLPAAVTWHATSQQVREDTGVVVPG